jgi:hypothetical protein
VNAYYFDIINLIFLYATIKKGLNRLHKKLSTFKIIIPYKDSDRLISQAWLNMSAINTTKLNK